MHCVAFFSLTDIQNINENFRRKITMKEMISWMRKTIGWMGAGVLLAWTLAMSVVGALLLSLLPAS